MYERILVPTDGSSGVTVALAEALDIAELSGGTVHALYVVDTRDYSRLPETTWVDLESGLADRGERALAAVSEQAKARGVSVETTVDRGAPHERILAHAAEHDVDLLVMGTHGRTGVHRFLLGSVTEKVVRSADVPVLTVRIDT
jgi:nucleotide-binding universal stress UspA family protein